MCLKPSLILCLIGIRVSLYNAVTEEQVDTLVKYMEDFVANEVKQTKAE